ncbi:MAG: septal ring lytic transglycosylase RlpA family protein [Bacteroidota bacterium]
MMKKILCLVIFLSPVLLATAQRKVAITKPRPVIEANADTAKAVDPLQPDTVIVTGKPVLGNATVYDLDYDGSKTASGETFSNIRLTAASNDFKLNSFVLITNTKNRQNVMVRINDRLSPKQKRNGVLINISHEAGQKLGIKKEKSIKVKVELIEINNEGSDSSENINKNIFKDGNEKTDSLSPNTFVSVGKAVNGIASFYSYNLDGTITATGERYRNALLTAASNNFKLNTWVLVTNLRNKKSVIVRINDRMHPRMKKKGRVVDLSREAARLLEFMDNGLTKVKVQPIKFVFSPKVKEELDSLHQADSLKIITDSTRITTDSTKADSVKTDDNFMTGIASFYSSSLDGTLTATGERYRNNKMSAASNDFNLNTWVRVTNLSNSRTVILRINDRMHPRMQKKGRVLDLSRIAAKKLNFIKSGLTKVKVEIVEKGTLN